MSVEIRRGTSRFVEREPGRLSRHAFSFGSVYDPERLRFGPMVCHDDHLLGDGRGFEAHRHSGLVIVTYVASGALAHTGDDGVTTVVQPGRLSVTRTGDGTTHSEIAAAPQTRFVQVWLADDAPPDAPTYAVSEAADWAEATEVVPGARLRVVDLASGGASTVELPRAAFVHAYVARGALLRNSLAEPLAEGDAFELADVPAEMPLEPLAAGVPTTLLIWEFDADRVPHPPA
ncbi:pirin family protein [Nocardioides sp.]|uniref:pirin family protein n=1 Tax=Nocardioides sp. TaxID=35761 RepID=UPI00351774B1